MECVWKATTFSLLAGETTDISQQEQFVLCVRYVDQTHDATGKLEHIVREDFLQFVTVTDLSGAGLAATLLDCMADLRLDGNSLVGQGYDGAAAMSGVFRGAQAHIQRQFPCALYVHCCIHALTLALTKASDIRSPRDCLAIIAEVTNFVNSSAARVHALQLMKTEVESLEGVI